jgi:nitrate reductase delta subunit
MFGSFASNPLQDAALARVEAEVRARFRLPEETSVLVTELLCALPGCPPLETVIAWWGVGQDPQRHHYKVFKPVQQVSDADLPPWWMRDALAAPPDWACSCC